MTPTDLAPAARQVVALLAGVRDAQLTWPTPSEDRSVGALVDHLDGLSQAFAAAARKELDERTAAPPRAAAAHLPGDWRRTVPAHVLGLVEHWREPAAWAGMTRAGGVELPGAVAGIVALDELVLHGWDLARATGQPFAADAESVQACLPFVTDVPEDARDGLFGPALPVPADTPPMERLLRLSGRDPTWQPPGQAAG